MINVVIADDNMEYAINLMNYINNKTKNIKVCGIAKNGKEAVEILNMRKDIDIVVLDYKMPLYNGQEVLERIKNKEKYVDSVIIISGEIESTIQLSKEKMIYSVIFKGIGIEKIVNKINELFEYKKILKII